jgi:hypothetical protein
VVGGVIGGVEGVLGIEHRTSYETPDAVPYRHHRLVHGRHSHHYAHRHHRSGAA